MPGSTLTGGGFQDILGNPIANGILVMELSSSATDILTGAILICAGRKVSYPLDQHGNIAGTPQIWTNNLVTPTTYYMARVYTQAGQLAWGPNAQYALGASGGTTNLTIWTPGNPVPSGANTLTPPTPPNQQ